MLNRRAFLQVAGLTLWGTGAVEAQSDTDFLKAEGRFLARVHELHPRIASSQRHGRPKSYRIAHNMAPPRHRSWASPRQKTLRLQYGHPRQKFTLAKLGQHGDLHREVRQVLNALTVPYRERAEEFAIGRRVDDPTFFDLVCNAAVLAADLAIRWGRIEDGYDILRRAREHPVDQYTANLYAEALHGVARYHHLSLQNLGYLDIQTNEDDSDIWIDREWIGAVGSAGIVLDPGPHYVQMRCPCGDHTATSSVTVCSGRPVVTWVSFGFDRTVSDTYYPPLG